MQNIEVRESFFGRLFKALKSVNQFNAVVQGFFQRLSKDAQIGVGARARI